MERHNSGLARNQYSVSPIQTLLDRLDNVRPTGDGYRANCPAVKHRSKGCLSVCERDDGTVLINCFAGCKPLAVLDAVGMEMKDLFPQPIGDLSPMQRRERLRFAQIAKWKAALSMLEREFSVLEIAHHQLASGHPLNETDFERVQLAGKRILGAKAVLCDR